MDNLKKRDFANFNNERRGNRDYPSRNGQSRDARYRSRPSDRDSYGVRNSRRSNYNNPDDKQVLVQYSNKGNKNGKPNTYSNFTSTVQQKFNSVLYRGNDNRDVDKRKMQEDRKSKKVDNKYSANGFPKYDSRYDSNHKTKYEVKHDKKINNVDVKNIEMMKREEEDQPVTIPKSVFVFITIAVIFATGLVVMLAQPNKELGNKVADNSEFVSRTSKHKDGDDGFETFAEEDEEIQENNEQKDLEESQEIEAVNEDTSGENKTENKTPENKTNIDTTSQTSSSSTVKTTTKNNEEDVTQTNVPRATLSPEEADDDKNQELANVTEDMGTFTIPSTVTGSLYKTSDSYAKIGSDGKFSKYTRFVKESFGTTVPRNELNGIWLFCKNITLSKSGITKAYGYRNGISVPVHVITIKKNGSSSTSYIYALNGTSIDLSDGTYKSNGATIRKLEVTGDKEIVQY